MSTPPHLQILTAGESDETALFTPFLRLSAELRLQIWELSMQRHRLFEVTFTDEASPSSSSQDLPIAVTSTKDIKKPPHTPIFHAWTNLHHPLLHTNHEARTAALRFYRVHIPCRVPLPLPSTATIPSTLYFSPEWDFLFFDVESDDIHAFEVSTLAVLADVRAADRMSKGVCNLALDRKLVLGWAGVDYDRSDSPGCVELKRVLEGLREVIWMAYKDMEHGEGDDAMPKWRKWWGILLLGRWDVEQETPPREWVLRARHFPEWERELYRVLREKQKEGEQDVEEEES
jgi:hypothetical protein